MAWTEDKLPPPRPDRPAVVLWVGSADLSQVMARRISSLVDAPDLKFLPVPQIRITTRVVADLSPSVALSMLTWTGGDALETATRLKACGFHGSYRAFSRNLPDRTLIEREIRYLVPGLDFAVIEFDADTEDWPAA